MLIHVDESVTSEHAFLLSCFVYSVARSILLVGPVACGVARDAHSDGASLVGSSGGSDAAAISSAGGGGRATGSL